MLSAELWFYRSEGNNNAIFTDINNSVVLRLPKIARPSQNHLEMRQHKSELSREMEFLEHVVYKILQDVHVQYRGEKIALTKDFIHQLSRKMKGKRPERYKNETLDETAVYGMIFPNFCKLLMAEKTNSISRLPMVSSSSPFTPTTISVELRPKTCYIPVCENELCPEIAGKCFFCLMKLYNQIKQPEILQTKYCPRDLYSGNKHRIKRAIQDLITCPQRYFSVRINDEDTYSNLTLAKALGEASFSRSTSFLRSFHRSCFDRVVSSHLGQNGREAFLNLLCEALQAPVISNHKEKLHSATTKQHCRRKEKNEDNSFDKCSYNGGRNSSILEFLASVHQMRYLPTRNLVQLFQKVKSRVEIHEEDAELLSLHSPYDARMWEKAAKISVSSGKNGFSKNGSKITEEQREAIEAAEKLRRFIIGRGFNCCSLIITLQKVESNLQTGTQYEQNKAMSITDGFGNNYLATISIVDLYKDLPPHVEKCYNREVSIIKCLDNYYSNATA